MMRFQNKKTNSLTALTQIELARMKRRRELAKQKRAEIESLKRRKLRDAIVIKDFIKKSEIVEQARRALKGRAIEETEKQALAVCDEYLRQARVHTTVNWKDLCHMDTKARVGFMSTITIPEWTISIGIVVDPES